MKKLIILFGVAILTSCATKEEKMKQAEEKGNEKVAVTSKLIEGAGKALQNEGKIAAESASKGIGEIVKGTNSGITESINASRVISEPSFQMNFEDCKANKVFNGDEMSKSVNVYLIAKKNFHGKLVLKAYNKDKVEIGRSSLDVSISADDAKYVDFSFDQRTDMMQVDYFVIK